MEGCKVNGSTIPPDILVCESARPDMVIVNRSVNPVEVTIVELTVPWDSSCEQAFIRKRDRYEFLVQDVRDRGYKCSNQPLEIGARGFISNRNRGVLTYLCHILKIRKIREVQKNCSKLALLGTYAIYCARNSKDWNSSRLLKP